MKALASDLPQAFRTKSCLRDGLMGRELHRQALHDGRLNQAGVRLLCVDGGNSYRCATKAKQPPGLPWRFMVTCLVSSDRDPLDEAAIAAVN